MTTPIHRVSNIGDISEVHYTLGIDYTRRHMTDLHWSHVEKAVSRTAFDLENYRNGSPTLEQIVARVIYYAENDA